MLSHRVPALHNCLKFSLLSSCLYEAKITLKKSSIDPIVALREKQRSSMSGLVPAHTNGLYRGPGMEAHEYRWLPGLSIMRVLILSPGVGWVAGL